MNAPIAPSPRFAAFKALLTGIIAELAEIGRPGDMRVAAE